MPVTILLKAIGMKPEDPGHLLRRQPFRLMDTGAQLNSWPTGCVARWRARHHRQGRQGHRREGQAHQPARPKTRRRSSRAAREFISVPEDPAGRPTSSPATWFEMPTPATITKANDQPGPEGAAEVAPRISRHPMSPVHQRRWPGAYISQTLARRRQRLPLAWRSIA